MAKIQIKSEKPPLGGIFPIMERRFYIRADRCASLYDNILILRGWETAEIGGKSFELNSILVEKWEDKAYQLVIQR